MIFFENAEEEKMAVGEVMWGRRWGQEKLIFAVSKACFFFFFLIVKWCCLGDEKQLGLQTFDEAIRSTC